MLQRRLFAVRGLLACIIALSGLLLLGRLPVSASVTATSRGDEDLDAITATTPISPLLPYGSFNEMISPLLCLVSAMDR